MRLTSEEENTSFDPFEGKAHMGDPTMLITNSQVMPSQLQQLDEVQFSGGEDRERVKDSRDLHSV